MPPLQSSSFDDHEESVASLDSTVEHHPLHAMVGDVGMALFAPLHLLPDDQRPNDKIRAPTTLSKSLPEQTVSLCPEDWSRSSAPLLLDEAMRRQIQAGLPHRLRGCCYWDRCYATSRDGDAWVALLQKCRPYAHSIVVVRTTEGYLLGGYASETWGAATHRNQAFYGSGQSFLFASHPCDDDVRDEPLTLYHWTGENDYHQVCQEGVLAMGGGGEFGWVVSEHFTRGVTGPCLTYRNPILVPNPCGTFEVEALELYGIVPTIQSFLSSLCSLSALPLSSNDYVAKADHEKRG
jgi:TLD